MAAPTITVLGTNTTQITLNQSTFIEMKDAVKNAITGLTIASGTTFSNGGITGWDLVWEGYLSRSNDYTQIFRSLTKEGATTTSCKPLILRWHRAQNEIWVNTSEGLTHTAGLNLLSTNNANISRDLTTNFTITNEAFTYYNCSAVVYKMDASDIIVNVNPRAVVIQGYINSEPGPWAGIFEIQRNDAKDKGINIACCWGYIGSTLWMSQVDNEQATVTNNGSAVPFGGNAGREYPAICMPAVIKDGVKVTGYAACTGFAIDLGLGQFPNWFYYNSTYNASYYLPPINAQLSNDFSPQRFQTSGWDTTKKVALPVSLIANYTSNSPTILGQIYGLKLLGPVGQNMNKMKLVVDSDGNYSATGTEKDHFILNTHFRRINLTSTAVSNSNHPELTSITLGTLPGNSTFQCQAIISIGSAYLVIQNNIIYKIDAFTGITTTFPTALSGGYKTHRFDGEQYIYVGTTNGIYAYDVYSGIRTSYNNTGSIQGITIGFDKIWFATNGAITAPQIKCIPKADLSGAIVTYSYIGTLAQANEVKAIEMDFSGSIVVLTAPSYTSVAYYNRIFALDTSNNLIESASVWYSSTYHNNGNARLVAHDTVAVIAGMGQTGGVYSAGTFGFVKSNNLTSNPVAGGSSQTGNYLFADAQTGQAFPMFRIMGNIMAASTRTYSTGANYGIIVARPYSASATTSGADTISDTQNMNIWCYGSDGIRIFRPVGTNCTGINITSGFGGERTYGSTGTRLAQVAFVA